MKILLLFSLIGYVSKALAQSPDSSMVKGEDFYKMKKYIEAGQMFEKALLIKPDNLIARYNLALTEFKTSDLNTSITNFNEIITRTKNKSLIAAANYNIGVAWVKAGNLPKAITAFKNTLRLNPTDSQARDNLQLALNVVRRQQQAAMLKKNAPNKIQREKNPPKENPDQPVDKKKALDLLKMLKAHEKKINDSLQSIKSISKKTKVENDW